MVCDFICTIIGLQLMYLTFHLEIALGSTVLLGCHGNLGALVEVCKLSKPSQLPVASELQLQPWCVCVCVVVFMCVCEDLCVQCEVCVCVCAW